MYTEQQIRKQVDDCQTVDQCLSERDFLTTCDYIGTEFLQEMLRKLKGKAEKEARDYIITKKRTGREIIYRNSMDFRIVRAYGHERYVFRRWDGAFRSVRAEDYTVRPAEQILTDGAGI